MRNRLFLMALLFLLSFSKPLWSYDSCDMFESCLKKAMNEKDPEAVLHYMDAAEQMYNSGNHYTASWESMFNLYIERSFLNSTMGHCSAALKDSESAYRIHPNDPYVFKNKGLAYYCLEEYSKAIDEYNVALEIKPDFAAAYNNRGLVYQKMGNLAQAVRDFQTALLLDSDGVPGKAAKRNLENLKANNPSLDIESIVRTLETPKVGKGPKMQVGSKIGSDSNKPNSDYIWGKIIGQTDTNESIIDMIKTSDGGYVLLCSINEVGNKRILIVKLDTNGEQKWYKIFADKLPGAIIETEDHGYLLTGSWKSLWFAKLDSAGNLDWQQTIEDESYFVPSSVKQTEDRGYLVSGTLYDSSPIESENTLSYISFLKLSKTGKMEWRKIYGLTGDERVFKMKEAPDGGAFLLCSSSIRENMSSSLLLKIDDNGEIEWAKKNSSIDGKIVLTDFAITHSGMIIAVGYSQKNKRCILIVQYDKDGKLISEEEFSAYTRDEATSIQVADDGKFVVAGRKGNAINRSFDNFVLGFDEKGLLLWQRIYGGHSKDGTPNFETLNGDDDVNCGGHCTSYIEKEDEKMPVYSDYGIDMAIPMGQGRLLFAGTSVQYGTDENENELSSLGIQILEFEGGDSGETQSIIKELQNRDNGIKSDDAMNIIQYIEFDEIKDLRPKSYTIIGSTGLNYLIFKISEEGHKQWAKAFVGSSGNSLCKIQKSQNEFFLDVGMMMSQWTDKVRFGFYESLMRFNTNGRLIENKESQDSSGYFLAEQCYLSSTNEKACAGKAWPDGLNKPFVFLIRKTAPNGKLLWDFILRATGLERIVDVKQTSDQGYLVGIRSPENTSDKTTLLKLSAAGKLLWKKSFDAVAYSMKTTADKGFLVVGEKKNAFWGLKCNSTGGVQLQLLAGNDETRGKLTDILELNQGEYIAVGTEQMESGSENAIAVGIGKYGENKWIRKIEGTNAFAIQKTADGGFIVANRDEASGGRLVIAKYDSSWTKKWSRIFAGSFKGSEIDASLYQTDDKGFLVSAITLMGEK